MVQKTDGGGTSHARPWVAYRLCGVSGSSPLAAAGAAGIGGRNAREKEMKYITLAAASGRHSGPSRAGADAAGRASGARAAAGVESRPM